MEQELKKLGLSGYESKVYLALVKYGSLNGKNLSKLSSVPQSKIYEVLYRLADRGFVSILNTKPKSFTAIDPEIAIKHFLKSKKNEIKKFEDELPKKLKDLKKTKTKYQEKGEIINVYRGRKYTLPLITNHYITAKKYVKTMITLEYLPAAFLREVKKCGERGIKMYVLATKKPDGKMNEIKKMKNFGAEIRYYPIDELRLGIRDGKECYQMVVNPKDIMDRTTISIESLQLTKALEHYFDFIWKKAKPVKYNI